MNPSTGVADPSANSSAILHGASHDTSGTERGPNDTGATSASLFRSEFLVRQRNDFLGPVILARPWSSWALVAITSAILTSGLAYAILGSYVRRTTVSGLLLPERGVVRVQSGLGGVVQQLFVREGQKVAKGDLLMIVAEEKQIAIGQNAGSRQLSQSQNDLILKRRDGLSKTVDAIRLAGLDNERTVHLRIERIKDQEAQNLEEINLLVSRKSSALEMAERFRRLTEAKAASPVELHEREEQANAIHAQLMAARRQRAELGMSMVGARGELEQNRGRTETQLSDFERELAALDQQLAEVHSREALAIAAPVAGTVAALNIQVGQRTGVEPLLVILPEGAPLVAHLYAPSRSIGFVQTGQEVRVRFHAFPYQKYGQHRGLVTDVARSPLSPSEILEKLRGASSGSSVTRSDAEGLYRVSVQLHGQYFPVDGHQVQLLPGMTFEADVLQERRRIIDWLLDPLKGAVNRVG